MARSSGIVSHIIPAAPPGVGRDRQSAADSSSEAALAIISVIPPGEMSRRGLAGPLPDNLPGALWGLLREQGLRTAVCSFDELLGPGGDRYRGVILCGDTPESVLGPLARLRQHAETTLLPVIVYLHRDPFAVLPAVAELVLPSWTQHADAVLESDSAPAEAALALQRLRRIAGALSALPALADLRPRSRRRLLLLRLLLTRGQASLQPRRDPHQPLCHSYPPLDLFGGSLLLADLDALAQLGLLERAFFERVCVCPSCGDARLLFREVCQSCLSADIRRGEVIHHYRCGHVAQEFAFHRGAELLCPSCGEALRHIGIDYERPAALLQCHACEHLAAEGLTQARCLACGQAHLAEAVGERLLWSYKLTPEGRAAAVSGQLPSFAASDDIDEEPL